MDPSAAHAEEASVDEPAEKFKPTSGMYVGWAGIALAVAAVVYVAVALHTLAGLRIALAALFAIALIWVTQLRPRVTAYPGRLVMHGTVRDTTVPLGLVDDVVMGQLLVVRAGGKKYSCVGIGRSVGREMRQRVRSQGTNSLFGSRAYQFTGRPEVGGTERQTEYHVFVQDRITDLVAAAQLRQTREERDRLSVRHRYAVPELAALLVTGVAFVVSLLL